MSYVVKAVTGIILLVAIGVPSLAAIGTAQASVANEDLGNMRAVQEYSLATDGLYAPTLDSLTSGGFGVMVTPRIDSEVAYFTNQARTHYIAATKVTSGGYAVSSDEAATVTCAEYNPECVSQLTTDAELIATAPVWVTF